MTPEIGLQIATEGPMIDAVRSRFRMLGRSTASAVAITRHGVLAAARRAGGPVVPPATRAGFMFVGSVLIGLGVAAFLRADLGLPPYDVALSSIARHTPLSHGQAGWMLGATMFLIASLFRRFPNLPALALVLLNGAAIDIAHHVVRAPEGLALRVLYVAVGMGFIATGLSVLIRAGSSGGGLELLMQAGADRGRNPARVRTALELTILVAGVAAGGSVGVATVVFAVAIGPAMRASTQALEDHRHGRHVRMESSLA